MYLKICTIKYRFPAAFRAYIYICTYFSSATHILQSGLREEAPSGEKREKDMENVESVRRDAPRLEKVKKRGNGEVKKLGGREMEIVR